MFCEKCGNPLPENSAFCSQCGAKAETENLSVQQNNADIEGVTASTVATEISEPINVAPTATSYASDVAQSETNSAPEATYCSNCGTLIPAGSTSCPSCEITDGAPKIDSPAPKKKKFFRKAVIIPVASLVAAICLCLFTDILAYAKNAVMKLILSPEDYFAYVITSNADDFSENFAQQFSVAKDSLANNSGGKAKAEFKLEDNFSDVIEDLSGEDISEYIDWFKSAAISLEANTDGAQANVSCGVDLNGVNLGTVDLIADMEDPAIYIGIPDYNSQYLYASAGYEVEDMSEVTEVLKEIISAFPDNDTTKELLLKYIKVAAESIEDVEKSTDTLEADGISQKMTALAVNIDGETIKDISLNFLKELDKDKEIQRIIDDIASAVDADADDFWEELDYAIDDLEDMDADEIYLDAEFVLYVNSIGEIAGFKLEADDFELTSYTTEKGSKFGHSTELDAGIANFQMEGNGKTSGNKLSGTFSVDAMGKSIIDVDVKDVDTKLLDQGVFNGSLTFNPSGDAVDLIESQAYGDFAALKDLSITISSSSQSIEESNGEISLNYKGNPCAKLILTASTHPSKKVSIPKNYIDAEDASELEDWAYNLNLSALTDKLRRANLPGEFISEVEYAIEDWEEALSYRSYYDDYLYDDYYDYDYDYYDDYGYDYYDDDYDYDYDYDYSY